MGNSSSGSFCQNILLFFGFGTRNRDALQSEYEHLLQAADDGKNTRQFCSLKELFTEDWKSYIKADGHYGSHCFINTCVLDALLVALHVCHTKYKHIQELFQSDRTMYPVMAFLDQHRYNEAKALWLMKLNLFSDDCNFKMSGTVNVWSTVKDHLPMFYDMKSSRDHFSETGANHGAADRLHKSILGEFQRFKEVISLGSYGDPCLILINSDAGMDRAPPLKVKDKYDRTFELQFMLLWKKSVPVKHMVVCCNLGDQWVLYDNDPDVPPDQDFNFESADYRDQYPVYLTGYVNTTQTRCRKESDGVTLSEVGLRPHHGPTPWDWKSD